MSEGWKITIATICFSSFLGLLIFLSILSDSKRPTATYVRANKPCEVVQAFENCCGLFENRFVITNKNRYKILPTANIIVGDSVCSYEWSDPEHSSSKLGIKNKEIFIYN